MMKKILLGIFILLNATFLYANDISSVDFVKNKSKTGDILTIQGILIAAKGDHEYIFQDATGQIPLTIRHFVLKYRGSPLPLNSSITLRIAIDKEIAEQPKFEAFEIIAVDESPVEASLGITPIAEIQKTANNNQAFTIKGNITKAVDVLDNMYQITDEAGTVSDITVRDFAFKDANIKQFNGGDIVVLNVVFRKSTDTGDTWFEVYRIVELNNSANP
ncbi:MAG: hypothetical protein LBQ34_06270 [Alphaproteobacteria bacterium]|nr:hypothetical protein [Alphaproteobacteria bacterium]